MVSFAGRTFPYKITHGMVKCFACGKTGHFRSACRSTESTQDKSNKSRALNKNNVNSNNNASYAEALHPIPQDPSFKPPVSEAWGASPVLSSSRDASGSEVAKVTVPSQLAVPSRPFEVPSPLLPLSVPATQGLSCVASPLRPSSPPPQLSSPSSEVPPKSTSKPYATHLPIKTSRYFTSSSKDPPPPLPQRLVRHRQGDIVLSRARSASNLTVSNTACLDLASLFLDAMQEKEKKGSYPSPVLLKLDVEKAFKTIESNKLFFDANSSFAGLDDFILEATEAQNKLLGHKDPLNPGKRAASSSDDLSSAASVRARPASKARKVPRS